MISNFQQDIEESQKKYESLLQKFGALASQIQEESAQIQEESAVNITLYTNYVDICLGKIQILI